MAFINAYVQAIAAPQWMPGPQDCHRPFGYWHSRPAPLGRSLEVPSGWQAGAPCHALVVRSAGDAFPVLTQRASVFEPLYVRMSTIGALSGGWLCGAPVVAEGFPLRTVSASAVLR